MRYFLSVAGCIGLLATAQAQSAVDVPRPEKKDQAEHAVQKQQEKRAQRVNVEFRGAQAFNEKELRSQLKEQLTTIDDYGLSPARADDVSFFLELFYRKHGYPKVNVRYAIERGDRLVLTIAEGPLTTLGVVQFTGNNSIPAEKLFEYVAGPTRERFSKLQKNLPFVAADIEEGVDLVHRLYVSEGYLDSAVDPPRYNYVTDSQVNVLITVHEQQQYFFGQVNFSGKSIYDPETLRGQMADLLQQPYTEGRLADIPRRLQAYYKARGYYGVKVDAEGEQSLAINGRIPVKVTVEPGPVYRFDGVQVTGLDRLRPGYLEKRFSSLRSKTYSPDVLDAKFRELMKSGLFNVLRIQPTPIPGDQLRLDISAEEAKSKEFGLSIGYGSYTGGIFGLQYSDRDLFGFGRPLTTSVEYSQRGYKGEVLYEDPYLFDTEFKLRFRVSAITFTFDGYTKFELGGRLDITRKLSKYYEVGFVVSARHVDITDAAIVPEFLGRTSYFVNTVGFTQTLDLRDSPVIPTRGLVFDNTLDLATSVLGGQVEFLRSTARLTYFIPIGHAPKAGEADHRSNLALGARGGVIHSLSNGNSGVPRTDIPIDERFFNGGSTTVRSFAERDLGPHDRHGYPVGGEFFTVFNAEYTFPLYGELQGAVFADAGNLLPISDDLGLEDLRYALGVGLRYKLPIGPIRVDYGVNPDRRRDEDIGAFHFSFGFAF